MKVSAFLFEDTKMAKFIIKFSRFLNNSALNVSAALMGLMALLVFYQVITRFVFGAPSAWSEISARVMMVWMVYISMGCVFSRGSMISITFFCGSPSRYLWSMGKTSGYHHRADFFGCVDMVWLGYCSKGEESECRYVKYICILALY